MGADEENREDDESSKEKIDSDLCHTIVQYGY